MQACLRQRHHERCERLVLPLRIVQIQVSAERGVLPSAHDVLHALIEVDALPATGETLLEKVAHIVEHGVDVALLEPLLPAEPDQRQRVREIRVRKRHVIQTGIVVRRQAHLRHHLTKQRLRFLKEHVGGIRTHACRPAGIVRAKISLRSRGCRPSGIPDRCGGDGGDSPVGGLRDAEIRDNRATYR